MRKMGSKRRVLFMMTMALALALLVGGTAMASQSSMIQGQGTVYLPAGDTDVMIQATATIVQTPASISTNPTNQTMAQQDTAPVYTFEVAINMGESTPTNQQFQANAPPAIGFQATLAYIHQFDQHLVLANPPNISVVAAQACMNDAYGFSAANTDFKIESGNIDLMAAPAYEIGSSFTFKSANLDFKPNAENGQKFHLLAPANNMDSDWRPNSA